MRRFDPQLHEVAVLDAVVLGVAVVHVDVPRGADHAFLQLDDALGADEHAAGRALDVAAVRGPGASMPSEIASVKASSTWLAGRVGPSTRTVGSIRRRGPTTITVSSAA